MTFKTECQQLFDRYVSRYREKDAAGCASVFAANAELYSPYGPPSIGRKAIEEIHAEWVAEGGDDKQIKVESAGCSGNLGWCLASFFERDAENGISLNILERQADGNWLITRCSLNEFL